MNLKHRDINWLYFNERVLLEAKDPEVPLLERLKFLAIFSSNLDEYFKVRVSQLRQLKQVDKTLRKKLILKANKKLRFILEEINRQQQRFGEIMRDILRQLQAYGIFFETADSVTPGQKKYITQFFENGIQQDCEITGKWEKVFLEDGQLYFVVQHEKEDWSFVAIPSAIHGRFHEIPGEQNHFIFLDDILRINLGLLFKKKKVSGSYAIKLSRDAELYLEDDYSDAALVEKIYQSLDKRETGQPTRLLFDSAMPGVLQKAVRQKLGIGTVDMFPGGRYHNLSDFFSFSNPTGDLSLTYGKKKPLPHPTLSHSGDMFGAISKKDQIIHFPYQRFTVVENFIETAATDPDVSSIKITLYRIAESSKLTDALVTALKNEKKVTIFVEAKARFDEENNISWGKSFLDHGAQVFFSVPNIKVHSKIALIERREKGEILRYAYIGTGNFNAETSEIYCDHGLFTRDKGITEDVNQVFEVLEKKLIIPKLKYILASPFNTRNTFLELIENEIKNAKMGQSASIMAKMNSLEDERMIQALYRASESGVHVKLLVRGFCCLIPKGKENSSSGMIPIQVTSIIDRYLEHGRIYLFGNGGKEKMFIGSADWMTRNLDRRIEVLIPILDADIFQELRIILDIQFNDNVKARIIDADDENKRIQRNESDDQLRSQDEIYEYLKNKLD